MREGKNELENQKDLHDTNNRSLIQYHEFKQTNQIQEFNREIIPHNIRKMFNIGGNNSNTQKLISKRHRSMSPQKCQVPKTPKRVLIHRKEQYFFQCTFFKMVFIITILLFGIIIYLDVVTTKSQKKITFAVQKQKCLRNYEENRCDSPVQAIEDQCKEWEICINSHFQTNFKITTTVASILRKMISQFFKNLDMLQLIILLGSVFLIILFILRIDKHKYIQEKKVQEF